MLSSFHFIIFSISFIHSSIPYHHLTSPPPLPQVEHPYQQPLTSPLKCIGSLIQQSQNPQSRAPNSRHSKMIMPPTTRERCSSETTFISMSNTISRSMRIMIVISRVTRMGMRTMMATTTREVFRIVGCIRGRRKEMERCGLGRRICRYGWEG